MKSRAPIQYFRWSVVLWGFLAFGARAESRIAASELARLETELAILDEIPVASAEFLRGFVRSQKILYRLERWDRLFAQAQFARARNLDLPPETVALEVLALTKHCAWNAAESVARWATQDAMLKGRSAEVIVRAASLLKLHQHFPDAGIPTAWSALPSTAFQSRAYWPVQADWRVTMERVAHPKHLRIIVPTPSHEQCSASQEGA